MGRVPLTPPIRFGTVAFPLPCTDLESDVSSGESVRLTSFSECLYRGAYPKARNLPFLSTLHLRTIVSLTPKPIDCDVEIEAWAKRQNGSLGVRIVHIRTEKPKEDTGGLTREGAARALAELLNRRNLPLYVHCLDGMDVTSTLIACLRKIQAWSEHGLRMELARGLSGSSSRLSGAPLEVPKHLSQFVERYGQPDGVVLPLREHIPCWVWPGMNMALSEQHAMDQMAVHHPTLKIYFTCSEQYISAQQQRLGAVWSVVRIGRASTPSSLSLSDVSSGWHSPPSPCSPHTSQDTTVTEPRLWRSASGMLRHAPDDDLQTPRAGPTYMASDIPSLDASESENMDRTPLVEARDPPRMANDAIPALGLENGLDVEEALDQDDDLDDDDDDDDDDPSQVLDALDLEGY
ncbi:hypothetical protein MVES1_001521 [Malassezia vespertilionis]|uniref:Uncharacterized protein n=1 Tax=Malassezia vespertilionis TaxID=2020962 RepID=A0A2N1JCH8_9BASI|nr:uncharacterized protein MVES1_001521 [Malassezia vespertilionis]PKI84232.1 hypothetical protein MVES_001434 [Malassezia vespertilionis]WFD06179.1 hypothetical protein MVES1_001521 [Malassezia vespertilionis]